MRSHHPSNELTNPSYHTGDVHHAGDVHQHPGSGFWVHSVPQLLIASHLVCSRILKLHIASSCSHTCARAHTRVHPPSPPPHTHEFQHHLLIRETSICRAARKCVWLALTLKGHNPLAQHACARLTRKPGPYITLPPTSVAFLRSIRVAVHDSRTNLALAWADLDLLEFGLGATQIEAGTVTMSPNAAVPQNTHRVGRVRLYFFVCVCVLG